VHRVIEYLEELADLVSRQSEAVRERIYKELLVRKVLTTVEVVDVGEVGSRENRLTKCVEPVVLCLGRDRPPGAIGQSDLAVNRLQEAVLLGGTDFGAEGAANR
jgi:hypothetical protein